MKLLREYIKTLLTEKELRGQKDKRVMYHIGKRPASPKPAERWGEQGGWTRDWIEGPVKSGVFLTPNPIDVVQHHGVSGNVYAYKVPEWVIDKAGGTHRFDSAGELLVSQEIWEEAGDEIEFLGKKMGQKELWDSIKSSWFGDRRYSNRKKKPGEVSISSLAQTKHPEQAIKMMTAQEREKAWEQFQEKYPGSLKGEPFEIEWEKVPGERKGQPKSWRIGEPRISKYDKKLIDLLQKHMKESVIREYVWSLLTEAALDVNDLGEKVIVIQDRGDTFSVTLHAEKIEGEKPSYYNKDMLGIFDAHKFGGCNGAYEVRWSEAPKGWGPLLYDVGLEYATMNGGGLVSDRSSVTPPAAHVWDYYYNNRGDVDYDQMDDLAGHLTPGDESDDCDQTIVYSGQHDSKRQTWDNIDGDDESWEKTGKDILLRSPLSKSYRWGGYSVLDDLRRQGKLVIL